MKENGEDRPNGFGADGIAFSVIMAIAAFLGRENPRFNHPQILWSFLALLSFNLLHFAWISRRRGPRLAGFISAAANLALVTAVLFHSGGRQSYFWVMYLLPVFTACLALDRRAVWAACLAAAAVLAAFYGPALRHFILAQFIEWLVKAATLCGAAAVTMRSALNEREARRRLKDERERIHEERAAMREKLFHMDRLATLGTLSAGLAHELNTPLATISGFAELALSGDLRGEELSRALGRIDSSVRQCRRVIRDTLAFARRQTEEPKPSDVNALARECVELKRFECSGRPVRMEEHFDPSLPKAILSGPEFQQALFNLLTNAQQAVRGNPGPPGSIRVFTESAPGKVRVRVADDGPGIPPDIIERIWEPFFTTKPSGTGTGLGLAICRQSVERQGGMISLRSSPGKGAEFVLEFPAAPLQVKP
jgi:signal transduction histidine kinase